MDTAVAELSPKAEKFDPKNLCSYFKNLVQAHDERYLTYWVKDQYGNDAGSVTYSRIDGWTTYVDNFPGQKKYFRCNYPVSTLEQFIADISRTGLKLVRITEVSAEKGVG